MFYYLVYFLCGFYIYMVLRGILSLFFKFLEIRILKVFFYCNCLRKVVGWWFLRFDGKKIGVKK